MSETSFKNLEAYLLETLTYDEMLSLGKSLIDRVKSNDLKPYTREEIDEMLEDAERDFENGDCYSTEEVVDFCMKKHFQRETA